jgi:hypothetical protein
MSGDVVELVVEAAVDLVVASDGGDVGDCGHVLSVANTYA